MILKYSVLVEYTLHSLTYLVDQPSGQPIGIKELAEYQKLSETYLSKAFSKLARAGIVYSVPGVKGGYELAKDPHTISFFDVIMAVEGMKPMFQCKNVKDQTLVNDDPALCMNCSKQEPCLINITMLEAEQQMHQFLKTKTLAWLNEQLNQTLSPERRAHARQFFAPATNA